MADLQIHGTAVAGFELVREQFEINFRQRGDIGASLAVYIDGALVVDLWGGLSDPVSERPWDRDTVALVFSATKGATAVVVNMLADRGLIDLEAPVAQYWPEFAANGKARITVGQLMSHQAGLPALCQPQSRADLLRGEPVAAALALQQPLWQPGSQHGYHALTLGWLAGELVRRVTGRTLGTVFAEDVAGPLGLDFWIGLPQERQSSVAPLIFSPSQELPMPVADPEVQRLALQIESAMADPTSLLSRTAATTLAPTTDAATENDPAARAATWNDPTVLAAEQPAANGVSNARSLARMYAACVGEVDGTRLLSEHALSKAITEQSRGADAVTMAESRWAVGFQLSYGRSPMLGESSFGHIGASGSLGFGDVRRRLGFGYVTNRVGPPLGADPRTEGILRALKQVLL